MLLPRAERISLFGHLLCWLGLFATTLFIRKAVRAANLALLTERPLLPGSLCGKAPTPNELLGADPSEPLLNFGFVQPRANDGWNRPDYRACRAVTATFSRLAILSFCLSGRASRMPAERSPVGQGS